MRPAKEYVRVPLLDASLVNTYQHSAAEEHEG